MGAPSVQRRLSRVVLVAVAATAAAASLGVGCVRAPMPMGGGVASQSPSTLCLLGVRGVRVTTDDVDGGMDVALTLFGSDPVELRRRCHFAFEGTTRDTSPPPPVAKPEPLKVASRVVVEDVGHGVMVHVHAVSQDDVKALRDEIHARIDRASSSRACR